MRQGQKLEKTAGGELIELNIVYHVEIILEERIFLSTEVHIMDWDCFLEALYALGGLSRLVLSLRSWLILIGQSHAAYIGDIL